MHEQAPSQPDPASPGTPNQTFAHSAEALGKLRLHLYSSPELWCLSSTPPPGWTLALHRSHACGTSTSPSPSCCSCPCLLLLMPWMDPSVVHPLTFSGSAGPYYQLLFSAHPARIQWGCTLAPVQVLGSPLAPSSSPALWSRSLTGRTRGAPQSQR